METAIKKILNEKPLTNEEDEMLSGIISQGGNLEEYFPISYIPLNEGIKKVLEYFEIPYTDKVPESFVLLIFYLSQQEEDDDPETIFRPEDKQICLSYMKKYREGKMNLKDWDDLIDVFSRPILKDFKENAFFYDYTKQMNDIISDIKHQKEMGNELHPLCEDVLKITNMS